MSLVPMESTMKITLVIVFLKAISAERIPKMLSPYCRDNKPTELLSNCCDFPEYFEKATLEGCIRDRNPVSGPQPSFHGSPECAEMTCLFGNNDLLFDNDAIDFESVKQYFDEWVAKGRREYQAAVDSIKEKCLGTKPMFGPKEMCLAVKLLLCIHLNFSSNCPNWRNTDSCRGLREYSVTCAPYY